MVSLQRKESLISSDVESKQSFNWISLPIKKVFETDLRLEASVYATKAEKAKKMVLECKYGTLELNDLMVTNHCPRFKRVFVTKSAYPIYQPSQIKEMNPLPAAYISDKTETDLELLRVKKGQILMTCSGTVGKVSYVSDTLDGKIFSHDLLRVNAKVDSDAGYLYVYFLSDIGRSIIQSNNYGAVIQHIEPSHLLKLPIPNAPVFLKEKIGSLIKESFSYRDEANSLINKAHDLIKKALSLPDFQDFSNDDGYAPKTFSLNVDQLNGRLEANYHNPISNAIYRHIKKHAINVLKLGDEKVVRKISLPGIFKRHYVDEGYGVPYIGGKDITSLDPRGERFLSIAQHKELISDKLMLRENTLLITCSGTIGKVTLVPRFWQGWVASHDLLRVVPNKGWEGYLYAWLSSVWAQPLIKRFTYGAVVPHIDQYHVADVPVPLIDNDDVKIINQVILEANELRNKAFAKEQQALNIFNDQILI